MALCLSCVCVCVHACAHARACVYKLLIQTVLLFWNWRMILNQISQGCSLDEPLSDSFKKALKNMGFVEWAYYGISSPKAAHSFIPPQYWNQPVCPCLSLSVSVSMCVQNTSFCKSPGWGIRSHLVTALLSTRFHMNFSWENLYQI